MNEPTMPSPPRFQGKTTNHHPHWQHEPLRLTRAQIADPRGVLEDFFECYHLGEVRKILWEWVVEVLSSNHSLSGDGLQRSNHLYFYEKIETLIEACRVLQNRTDDTADPDIPGSEAHTPGNDNIATADNTTSETGHFFNKDIPLVETATTDPKGVIRRIFHEESYEILSDNLAVWYHMAIACNNSVYDDDPEQREQLIRFYEGLRILLSSLYDLDSRESGCRAVLLDRLPKALQKDLVEIERFRVIYSRLPDAAWEYIADFFNTFPMDYITAELEDWLSAGISYEGRYCLELTKPEVLDTYRHMQCLIRAAGALLNTKATASGAASNDSSGDASTVRRGVAAQDVST